MPRSPPRPRLTLNIGITGHRATILPPAIATAVQPVVDEIFRELHASTLRLHAADPEIFAETPALLRLHTPLATGADQLAAESARASGYYVRALLPFAPAEYRKDFAKGDELTEFNRQLDVADDVFALPGDRSDEESAYVMVGKAVIAAADILVAVWDGREGNGPGGTAHVVDLALGNMVPVVHVAIDRDTGRVSKRLLIGGDAVEPVVQPLEGADGFDALVRDTLAPHTEIERRQLAGYFQESERRTNLRIEYPALLAMLGIKSLPSRPWLQASLQQDVEREWAGVRSVQPVGAFRALAPAYAWANFLAIRYAQLFRSGHVTNYALSALAVILALFGLIVPEAKFYLVIAELATIGLLFYNTTAGTGGEWHRRWLQYRHLAESLRPLIYLKRTGLISTPFRSDFVHGRQHREAGADWTRWYAAAIWREMDSPSGTITEVEIRQLAEDVLHEQVDPQAQYHQVNAARMHKLDHRLHEIGNFLMGAVIASCVLFLIGYFPLNDLIKSMSAPFIFLTAGLPALGAAVFGMRGHGEHLLAASRSANTATALAANGVRLAQARRLDDLSAELQRTAEIMLADLNEWTVAYSERSLEVPA